MQSVKFFWLSESSPLWKKEFRLTDILKITTCKVFWKNFCDQCHMVDGNGVLLFVFYKWKLIVIICVHPLYSDTPCISMLGQHGCSIICCSYFGCCLIVLLAKWDHWYEEFLNVIHQIVYYLVFRIVLLYLTGFQNAYHAFWTVCRKEFCGIYLDEFSIQQ